MTLLSIITMMTPTRMSALAAVSGMSTTTWFTCWMSVFARAMSWPVWAWSWNAKCRRWRCANSRWRRSVSTRYEMRNAE